MNRIDTLFLNRKLWHFSFIATFALLGACEQPRQTGPSTPAESNSAVGNTAPPANSQAPPSSPGSNLPVTMPLLDAMFADEAFTAAAKQELQLSDDELAKIQDAARNTVLELGSDVSEDDARSTRTAVTKARSKIEAIIGAERTEQFFNFV